MNEELIISRNASKGGKARAATLTPEQRSQIAREAATARWAREGRVAPVQATHGAPERPLKIGEMEIPCYVLADGTRVLAQRGLQTSIGMSRSGGKPGARRVATFLASLGAKGLQVSGLIARINNPIRFMPPIGGNIADGFEATILPEICEVVLEARRRDMLPPRYDNIAKRCEILVSAFSKLGIIALVDEATGFQDDRGKAALAKILEAFIAKELRKWVSTFPLEYYKEVFRLRKWTFPKLPADQNKRSPLFGRITNDLIYDRLAPGIRTELHRLTPRDDKGRLKFRLHRWLTEDIGHPKLREHLASIVTLMRASDTWNQFKHMLDRSLPRYGDTGFLPFED